MSRVEIANNAHMQIGRVDTSLNVIAHRAKATAVKI